MSKLLGILFLLLGFLALITILTGDGPSPDRDSTAFSAGQAVGESMGGWFFTIVLFMLAARFFKKSRKALQSKDLDESFD